MARQRGASQPRQRADAPRIRATTTTRPLPGAPPRNASVTVGPRAAKTTVRLNAAPTEVKTRTIMPIKSVQAAPPTPPPLMPATAPARTQSAPRVSAPPSVAPNRVAPTDAAVARRYATTYDRAYALVAPWVYRGWLIVMTALLAWALLWLQNRLGAVPEHPSTWQRGVQWAELIWLTPVPLAVALWLGWFIFAEVPRRDPQLTPVPWVATAHTLAATQATATRGVATNAPSGKAKRRPAPTARRPARLIFRFVTRGDNLDVLHASVMATQQTMLAYAQRSGKAVSPYGVEVVSEHDIPLPATATEAQAVSYIRLFVVPPGFATATGSSFKARALTYLQMQSQPQPEDWYLYLDEESVVTIGLIAGVYRFVERAERATRAGRRARVIGQGAILYQGGSWFFRGADALRTADDMGRFRLQYALGAPLFGVHGSYIVVRGRDDQQLSFDVGHRLSLTEDAAWALRAWSKGYRFGWVDGYLCEQPPQRVGDFVGQRARWLTGIRQVIADGETPLRYRLCLAAFTALWQISFLPFLVAVAALIAHIAPFTWMRLPSDFAWATFVLAYLQGAHLQATRHVRLAHAARQATARQRAGAVAMWGLERLSAWAMTFCYIWFALLEALSVLFSLAPRRGFFVIQKPTLMAGAEVTAMAREAPLPLVGQT